MKKNLLFSDPYRLIVLYFIDIRKQKCLKQEELANILERDQQFVSRVESFSKALNIEEFYDYCKALDLDFIETMKKYKDYIDKLNKIE